MLHKHLLSRVLTILIIFHQFKTFGMISWLVLISPTRIYFWFASIASLKLFSICWYWMLELFSRYLILAMDQSLLYPSDIVIGVEWNVACQGIVTMAMGWTDQVSSCYGLSYTWMEFTVGYRFSCRKKSSTEETNACYSISQQCPSHSLAMEPQSCTMLPICHICFFQLKPSWIYKERETAIWYCEIVILWDMSYRNWGLFC